MKQTVRITGGAFRSRTIATPGGDTHPMGDRERLAIFNSLVSVVHGARVLDMFAGSGALGIEALSRGAAHVTFVDNSHKARDTIKQNLQMLDQASHATVSSSLPHDNAQIYDLIFADPPYDIDIATLNLPHLANILTATGTLVLSTVKATEIAELFGDQLTLISDKTYARARITMWTKTAS